MSENLSIDEIIKRAEKIKAEAEKQLVEAEKALDEKTKNVIDDIVVDAQEVLQNTNQIVEKEEIKEFVPKKPISPEKTQAVKIGKFKENIKIRNAVRIEEDDEDEDIKIAPSFDKTRRIDIESDDDMKIAEPRMKKEEERTRPVILSSNTQKDDEGFHSIPTIVAHDKIDDVLNTSDDYDDEFGIQMSFDGFDDAIETVPTIDEEVAEQILEQRRQEKVGKFRLFGPDETDMELGNDKTIKEDYVNADETSSFLNSLIARKNSISTKLIITLALGLPMLFMTVFKDSSFFPTVLSGDKVYFVVGLVFIIATIITDFNVIIHGFNFKKGINFDFSVSLLSILTVVHTVVMLFNESLWIDNGVFLGSAMSFGLFMSQLGKRQMMLRIIDNFEFISANEDKYTIENIANSVDSSIITRGVLDENMDPVVKTSVKTDFPTNFMEISTKNEPADKISRAIAPASFLLSAVLLVIVGIIDNFNTGINVAMCALAASTPIASLFLTNDMLYDVSASLDNYGSRVCGYEGAVMASSSNAMVLEAADLFGKKSCDLHGIKTFNGAKVDDAIIQAAAVIIQTKSPLAHVFDNVIIGKQSILPKVENITYEDRMGTSAWIYRQKVLVGNRDLLIRHNVSVPKMSFEEKYTRKGRKALYLAVAGKIVAMFVVSYSADPDLKRELRKLEKSGITLIVKSCDPYINEESINALFDLPEGYVRVMNSSAARAYDKYSDMRVEKSPAYVVHDGTALGFVSAMRGAEVAINSKSMITFLVSFGAALGFLAVALLAVIKGYSQISTFNIIAFQLIWNVFVLIISKLRRVGI